LVADVAQGRLRHAVDLLVVRKLALQNESQYIKRVN
jgi:hypothetical protein